MAFYVRITLRATNQVETPYNMCTYAGFLLVLQVVRNTYIQYIHVQQFDTPQISHAPTLQANPFRDLFYWVIV